MEVMVGTFMFVVLTALCVFTILLSRENFFQKTYPFTVVFEDIMGLRDGDNVVVRGMTVGKVKSMVMQPDGVHVIAALTQPLFLKTDYRAEVVATSVLGGRHLQVHEGKLDSPPLPQGGLEPAAGDSEGDQPLQERLEGRFRGQGVARRSALP